MSVLWSPGAIRDVRHLRAYIAQRDPGSAAVVIARLRSAVRILEEFPSYGRPGKVPGTRELVVPRTPYIVIYRIAGQHVQLARVLHGAQEWPTDV